SRLVKTVCVVVLLIGAIAGLGALIVRDQISRHKRDLFSGHAFRRFAALGYLSRMPASIDLVRTLRDFVAREPRSLLRSRARSILGRMESALEKSHVHVTHAGHGAAGEYAG
ncbi:MAG: hypothetical protein ACT4O1_09330, partial [Gemmatimonadota bacterium]